MFVIVCTDFDRHVTQVIGTFVEREQALNYAMDNVTADNWYIVEVLEVHK